MPALGAMSSLAASGAVGVASDLATAPDDRSRMLPVHPAIAGLFPGGGLRRGATVVVRGSTSLLFALLARATETGSWAALVGMPDLGLKAAAELGVAVERLALVRHPGADLPRVVAALLDGMDLVAVDPNRLADAHIRRLSARARHRGAVLVSTGPWPGADLELTQEVAAWAGLGDGHGHLTMRETHVRARGKGAASRPTEAWLRLPAADGAMADALGDPFGTLPVPKGPLGSPAEQKPSIAALAGPDPDALATLPAPRSASPTPSSRPGVAKGAPAGPSRKGALQTVGDGKDSSTAALDHDDPCVIDFALGPPSRNNPAFTGRGA